MIIFLTKTGQTQVRACTGNVNYLNSLTEVCRAVHYLFIRCISDVFE